MVAPRTKRGRKPGDDLSLEPKRRKSVKSEPLTEVPQPPDYLGEHAKKYWCDHAEQLVKSNLLTKLHIDTFAVLCETWQEYRVHADYLAEDPNRCFFVTENGYQQETPQVRMRDKALANLAKLWMKFGLTPHALATMRKHGGISSGAKLPSVMEFAKKKYE